MKKIVFFALIIVLSSCSPQKRLAGILKRNPDLINRFETNVTIRDSFYSTNSFYTPGSNDTFNLNGDTVIGNSDYQFKRKGNLFNLQIYPDTFISRDTFYSEHHVAIPGKVIDLTPDWLKIVIKYKYYIFFLTLCLTLILTLIRQYFKEKR